MSQKRTWLQNGCAFELLNIFKGTGNVHSHNPFCTKPFTLFNTLFFSFVLFPFPLCGSVGRPVVVASRRACMFSTSE